MSISPPSEEPGREGADAAEPVRELVVDREGSVESVGELGPMLANIRDYWIGWGAEKCTVTRTALFRSGVDHPILNGVRQSVHGDSWARVQAELDGVPWMWWLGEDSPPDLADALLKEGAVEVGSLPVWSAEIRRVPAHEPPPGLRLGQVTRPEDVDDWVRMWVPASDLPAELAPAMGRAEQVRPLPPDGGYVRLAGWMDGELVASAVLLVAHEVAGVYVVSTKETHRRRGIGWAVTAAALDMAAERGVQVAVLNPTSQGERLYRRMGFEPVSEFRILAPAGD